MDEVKRKKEKKRKKNKIVGAFQYIWPITYGDFFFFLSSLTRDKLTQPDQMNAALFKKKNHVITG